MSNRETGTNSRREEFLRGEQRYRGPNRVVILVVLLGLAVGVGWFVAATRDNAATPSRWQGGTYNIGKTVQYSEQASMTDIANKVVGPNLEFPLSQVVDNSIIYTEYRQPEGGELVQALTAFISPAGRLVVAIAKCEPCRSQRFHIEGDNLVCDTCGTRWFLNNLRGLSGGCTEYPPEELPYEVTAGGMVAVSTELISGWTPRTVEGSQLLN